ncbi:pseudouridine-5-phosphate glycosidase [Brachybacterium endophyticum]|uniref:Pseudouridine-5'-phosphate glycosidase n=1 Tax=Brachybacterium endophyticum TaxID=2182385 RepID=A0A2U2RND9_9MICO|nr:pseudouridine-5'-phosphate glycosidase [Brachybacterium endophyticum]PWH07383.1 pseudouridine-5-phosphate glycosidase [Brachybacterium endophyticum]
MSPFLTVSAEVAEAVREGLPVVALESTIFTHGLPRPRNVEVAEEAERIVRDAGAVPATIGVHRGRPVVGLTMEQITELAHDDDVLKAGIRELPLGAVNGRNAGTTIAATSQLAHSAGISVFATGGLGGVHQGAETTFDESADLVALSRNPVVMVSSGAKAVLDVHATLERFETLSVPVVGYRTTTYPGFYVRESGFRIAHQLDSPEEIASVFAAQRALEMTSALLVANPVPADEQLDPALLQGVIEKAWAAVEDQSVEGQQVTPFLLDFIRRETGGASLDANVALYRSNVSLAAEVAREISRGSATSDVMSGAAMTSGGGTA